MTQILYEGKSDIGRHRSENEDDLLVKPEAGFVALADGMGGAASGEVASKIFIETASEIFSKRNEEPGVDMAELVQNAYQDANDKIREVARTNPQHTGMGCTAELMVFDNQGYVLGHVGDSRTYVLRRGKLRQITKDHSVVQAQIDQGIIKPEEARNNAFQHIILRAVGIGDTLAVDLIKGQYAPGDLFLICSDGLTDMIDDASILEVLLLPSADSSQKLERLIEKANAAGGRDNITVILCEVKEA